MGWARTQNSLGNACCELPTGSREENVRRAIAYYEDALTVFTREAHPGAWIRTQFDLAVAQHYRAELRNVASI